MPNLVVGSKLKIGKGKCKPNFEPGPNFEQRDRPLLGVKAVVDLTLIQPLEVAIKCQE